MTARSQERSPQIRGGEPKSVIDGERRRLKCLRSADMGGRKKEREVTRTMRRAEVHCHAAKSGFPGPCSLAIYHRSVECAADKGAGR